MDPRTMENPVLKMIHEISPDRRLLLSGPLTESLGSTTTQSLFDMEVASTGPILSVIDSSGGDYAVGLLIHDSFRVSTSQIIGLVKGRAKSSAFMALQGCHVRVATENSRLGIHFMWTETTFKATRKIARDKGGRELAMRQLNDELDEVDTNATRIMKLIRERCGIDESRAEELDTLLDSDIMLSAEEALAWGFIDHIV